MKAAQLRQKTEADLRQLLEDQRKKLAGLNFDLASGKVKNIKEVRSARRDIARLMTILNQGQTEKK